eukprot:11221014-Lingulodinium_polyedra.AAC.1
MGICLAGVHTECGLPAGCIDALAMVVVYTIRSFDQYVARHVELQFDTFVDDFVGSAEDDTRAGLENKLAAGAADLAYVVKHELKGSLAKDKTGVVATDPLVAKELARRIRPSLGGQPGVAVANLGIDYAPGQPRRRHCIAGKRMGRFKSLKARLKRAARLRAAAGPAAAKVYYCGIRPAITYGSAVHGISPTEQHRLRVALMGCKAPVSRGASLRAKMAIYGDPTAEAAIAPIITYHKELWGALTKSMPGLLTLKDLRSYWVAAAATSSPSWACCKGPLNAMLLSLQRLGWKMESFCDMEDDLKQQ